MPVSINGTTGLIDANVSGIITGNLTGNVTGDVTGDVTGNLIGDVIAQNIQTTLLSALQNFYYPPDYDSDWFSMSSQAGTNSYKELSHNLNQYPAQVKVLIKAIDGNNSGFIFEGMGSAQTDDDQGEYGGVIFAYNQTKIRLWAPDQNNGVTTGRIICVQDGWGGEVNNQFSQTADVRVLAWKGFYNLN